MQGTHEGEVVGCLLELWPVYYSARLPLTSTKDPILMRYQTVIPGLLPMHTPHPVIALTVIFQILVLSNKY